MNTSIARIIKPIMAFVLLSMPITAWAQYPQINNGTLEDPLPADSQMLKGKLDNGMTYYLRQNEKPDNRIELRLVINAGSMQEDEDQLGLAHFTEHMAFNGTESYEKNKLVDYLQSQGVKFGADLNAYTSFDETVYMLPIPADDPQLLEQSLTILHDWASQITFDKEEIDKERGVVIEEWRLGQNPSMRMLEEYLPVLFKDSRYAERLPIGKKEIIENFERETIVEYYENWYRPDLMSIIAVGDFGIDSMRRKIVDKFGSIEPHPDAPERKAYPVPDHDTTYFAIATDKEASFSNVELYYKKDPRVMKNEEDLLRSMKYRLFTGMLNRRLNELRQKANPPFIGANVSYGNTWARTKSAYQASATAGDQGIMTAYEALLTENERVQRHGFTQGELERYKKVFMQNINQAYKERNKTNSSNFVSEYMRNFLEDEPVPGIAFEKAFYEAHIQDISIEDINPLADELITDNNRVVVVTAPDTSTVEVPSKQQLRAMLEDIENREIEPYNEKILPDELMAAKPGKGSIAQKEKMEKIGATKLVLGNGATIYYKPTDFKNEQILMEAYSPGGHSLVPDEHFNSAKMAAAIVNNSGLKDFSSTDLQKILSGKKVSLQASIGKYREGFSGNTSPQDLETFFQMLNLYFTNPGKDKEAFQSFISKQKSIYQNVLSNPRYFFYDKLNRVMSQNHLRGDYFWSSGRFDSVEYETAHRIFRERFANPGDFNFFFVGNIAPDSLEMLAEQYIGSIPGEKAKEKWKNLSIDPPKGKVTKVYKKGSEPQSRVFMAFHGKFNYSPQEQYKINALSQVLSNMYIDSLREKESGVYGISVNASVSKYPNKEYLMQIMFPCAPDNTESLIRSALDIIDHVKNEGITQEQLKKVTSSMKRDIEVNQEKNNYWVSEMEQHHFLDLDMTTIPDQDRYVDNLTPGIIQKTAKKYLDTSELKKIIMYPEGYEASK